MKRNRVYLVLALVAAVASLPATPATAQAGPDETARFLKTVEGTVKSIGESKAQLQKTVATYNSITEMTAPDLKGAYKDLNKDIAESGSKGVIVPTPSHAKDGLNAVYDYSEGVLDLIQPSAEVVDWLRPCWVTNWCVLADTPPAL